MELLFRPTSPAPGALERRSKRAIERARAFEESFHRRREGPRSPGSPELGLVRVVYFYCTSTGAPRAALYGLASQRARTPFSSK